MELEWIRAKNVYVSIRNHAQLGRCTQECLEANLGVSDKARRHRNALYEADQLEVPTLTEKVCGANVDFLPPPMGFQDFSSAN